MQQGCATLPAVGDPIGAANRIERLVGVYDADGTLRGEVTYWVSKRLGRAHCALCDITHGSVRERPDWRRCRDSLPVPFDTYHRDDQPDAVREIAADLPAVVAMTGGGVVVMLGPDDLEACEGSPERMASVLEKVAGDLGLSWR